MLAHQTDVRLAGSSQLSVIQKGCVSAFTVFSGFLIIVRAIPDFQIIACYSPVIFEKAAVLYTQFVSKQVSAVLNGNRTALVHAHPLANR